ncbi:prolyl oligopeptidase family serine peptidase [Yinghuangia aomiensis]
MTWLPGGEAACTSCATSRPSCCPRTRSNTTGGCTHRKARHRPRHRRRRGVRRGPRQDVVLPGRPRRRSTAATPTAAKVSQGTEPRHRLRGSSRIRPRPVRKRRSTSGRCKSAWTRGRGRTSDPTGAYLATDLTRCAAACAFADPDAADPGPDTWTTLVGEDPEAAGGLRGPRRPRTRRAAAGRGVDPAHARRTHPAHPGETGGAREAVVLLGDLMPAESGGGGDERRDRVDRRPPRPPRRRREVWFGWSDYRIAVVRAPLRRLHRRGVGLGDRVSSVEVPRVHVRQVRSTPPRTAPSACSSSPRHAGAGPAAPDRAVPAGHGGFGHPCLPAIRRASSPGSKRAACTPSRPAAAREEGEDPATARHALQPAARPTTSTPQPNTSSPALGGVAGGLGISGGSNGGLLVGAALTQRPDLYAAVVCSAPLLDMVRYEQFGSAAP